MCQRARHSVGDDDVIVLNSATMPAFIWNGSNGETDGSATGWHLQWILMNDWFVQTFFVMPFVLLIGHKTPWGVLLTPMTVPVHVQSIAS